MNESKKKLFLICAVLILITFIAFEPVRHNGFTSYDDRAYITTNPHITGGLTLESVCWAFSSAHYHMWHPLTSLSYLLDYQLFELRPFGYHFNSVLLHIANVVLLFCLLKRITGALWPSAFVAAIFAVHPLQVESVAWIAERKTVLSGFFWILTLAAYAHYCARPRISKYLIVLLAFSFAVISKPVVVTLPLVLLLLDFWPLDRFGKNLAQNEPDQKRYRQFSISHLVAEKVPLLILSAVLSIITFVVQKSGGAVNPLSNIPINYRIANTFTAYMRYIGKMIWPSRLAIFYPHPGGNYSVAVVVAWAVLLLLLSACFIYAAHKRRYLAVGWLWFLGTLVPVIGMVQAGAQAMANRYMYIPMIGLLIIVAWGIDNLIANRRYRRVVAIVLTVLVIAAVTFTRIQVKYWQNDLTLFRHTLDVTKNNAIIHNSYACALFEDGQIDQVESHLNEALRIIPTFSKARNNLGKLFLKQQKARGAIFCFKKLLKTDEDSPQTNYNLAMAYDLANKKDLAIQHYSDALKLKPDYPDAHNKIALVYAASGKDKLAVTHWTKALDLKPDSPGVLNNLGWVLATSKDSNIFNSADAVRYARRACELTDYNQLEVLDTLAVAYAAAGQFTEAAATAEKALELAQSSGQKQLADKIRKRLEKYKTRQSYNSN